MPGLWLFDHEFTPSSSCSYIVDSCCLYIQYVLFIFNAAPVYVTMVINKKSTLGLIIFYEHKNSNRNIVSGLKNELRNSGKSVMKGV